MFKLIAAGFLIPLGLVFLLAIATEFTNPAASSDSRMATTVGGLILGLPAVGIGGWLVWDWYRDRRRELYRRQRYIRSIFLHLVRDNKGLVAVRDLARSANLSPQEAKAFLDRAARKYNATSQQLVDGETYYQFNL